MENSKLISCVYLCEWYIENRYSLVLLIRCSVTFTLCHKTETMMKKYGLYNIVQESAKLFRKKLKVFYVL